MPLEHPELVESCQENAARGRSVGTSAQCGAVQIFMTGSLQDSNQAGSQSTTPHATPTFTSWNWWFVDLGPRSNRHVSSMVSKYIRILFHDNCWAPQLKLRFGMNSWPNVNGGWGWAKRQNQSFRMKGLCSQPSFVDADHFGLQKPPPKKKQTWSGWGNQPTRLWFGPKHWQGLSLQARFCNCPSLSSSSCSFSHCQMVGFPPALQTAVGFAAMACRAWALLGVASVAFSQLLWVSRQTTWGSAKTLGCRRRKWWSRNMSHEAVDCFQQAASHDGLGICWWFWDVLTSSFSHDMGSLGP